MKVRNEIAILKKISMGHRNILSLVDYFETVNNLYLVTDLALGGELFDRICRKGSYYETDAAGVIVNLVSAVAYLHDHEIIHQDLKPENLLFRTPEDNADILIADFGLARIIGTELAEPFAMNRGSPFSPTVKETTGYQAPETFKNIKLGKPVDMWAVGIITYFMLCGFTPFDRDSLLEEAQAIRVADFSFAPVEYWRDVSMHARDFITQCLTADPSHRITAHEALEHPFLKRELRLPTKN
jgi:calcium/calmodulin-dependent protein kinase I